MAKTKSGLAASEKAIDPNLEALFISSAGPLQTPPTFRYSAPPPEREPKTSTDDAVSDTSEQSLHESDAEIDEDDEESERDASSVGTGQGNRDGDDEGIDGDEIASIGTSLAEPPIETQKKERKRKRKDEYDDLEDKYMRKLAGDDEGDGRRDKRRREKFAAATDVTMAEYSEPVVDEEDGTLPVHESIVEKSEDHVNIEVEKATRTLFLGNVSSEAIASPAAKKQLISHLSSPLSELESSSAGPHKVESLRFRSVAFSAGALPKRAAFITKSLMSATTKSTNAYVVYTTPLAARTALKALNGTVVLDRHIRVDSVAHPSPIDHRRCVFVGNLGFVDDETVFNVSAEGETTSKKRTKVPADTEEGLWQTFGKHVGKVENVRLPRDDKTRVGKGFAYVQFYDGNDVESALLLDGKKFPPLLPRALRVSRAKDPRKTALAIERSTKAKLNGLDGGDTKSRSTKYRSKVNPDQQSQVGRAGRLLGRAGAAKQRHDLKGRYKKATPRGGNGASEVTIKTPEQIVFEGRRATSKDGKPRDLKFGKTKGKRGAVRAKAKSRGSKRAAEWRKSSSKK